jgi:hypothetical protein
MRWTVESGEWRVGGLKPLFLALNSPLSTFSKPAFRPHVIEVAQVVLDTDKVEHAAQTPQGHAHSVGTAETAELAASFEVRLQVDHDARNATLG